MAKRIMAVDDEPSVLRSISRLLENEGYEVITATSGKECLEKLKGGEKVDLIILDMLMPEIDGAVVCRKIRQNKGYDKIKIIFLTIMKKLPGMEKLLEGSKVSYYITKPFENEDLLEKVSKVLKDN